MGWYANFIEQAMQLADDGRDLGCQVAGIHGGPGQKCHAKVGRLCRIGGVGRKAKGPFCRRVDTVGNQSV